PPSGPSLPFPSVDRRSFLRGSLGVAVAGALAQVDIARAAAQTPAAPDQTIAPVPPASWPPAPGAFDGLTSDWVLAENTLPGSDGWRIGGGEPAGTLAAS